MSSVVTIFARPEKGFPNHLLEPSSFSKMTEHLPNETARIEASDYPAMGPVGANAVDQARTRQCPRLVQVLS